MTIRSVLKKIKAYEWLIVSVLAGFSFLLGVLGHWLLYQQTGVSYSVTDLMYRSFQLFFLEFGPEDQIPWILDIARWLAPFTLAITAIKAFFSIAGEQFDLLKAKFYRDHSVICGLGRTGSGLAKDLLVEGERLIIVDNDQHNSKISTFREMGALIIIGNGSDVSLLRKLGVGRAKHLVAVCGDDAINVEIAMIGRELAKKMADARQDNPLKCQVRVRDHMLSSLIYEHPLFAEDYPWFRASVINSLRSGVRLLFEKHAPDRYQPVTSADTPPLHIMIAGLSEFGRELVVQAARNGHYIHQKKLIVSVVDNDITAGIVNLKSECPALENIVDLQCMETLPDLIKQDIPITVAYLCHPRFEQSVADMTTLSDQKELKTQIIVIHLDDTPVNTILSEHPGFENERVHRFYFIQQACSADAIFNQRQDAMARQYHQGYLEEQKRQGKVFSGEPNTRLWPQLSEHLKDSNRFLVDHLSVKLRAIGITTQEAVPDALLPEQIESLAKTEHDRWMAERFLSGWRYAPKKDIPRKLSPYLIGWDQLTEDVKDYDRKAVMETLRIYKNM